MISASNQNVNFIPEEVLQAKKQQVHLSFGLKASFVFAILLSAVWGGLFYFNLVKERAIKDLDIKIAAQRKIIDELAEFGAKGYKLGVRLEAVKDVVNTRNVFSKLIEELNSKVPESVAITDVTVTGDNNVIVSGEALYNYAPVGEYTEKLLTNKEMFEDVKIISAQGVGQKDAVKFTLNIKLKKGGLYEPIK